MKSTLHTKASQEEAVQRAAKPQSTRNVLLLNPGGPGIMMRGLIRERPTQFGFCWPSVDAIITSGFLNEYGHQLNYIDASIDRLSADDVAKRVQDDNIDVLISLYSHFYRHNDVQFLQHIKESNPMLQIVILPDIQFVLIPNKALEFLKDNGWLDAIIMNLTNNDLEKFLQGDFEGSLINMAYRMNGEALLGTNAPSGKNDYAVPIPRHDIFKNNKYFLPQSRTSYITTTVMQFGCPYKCDFCLDKEAYEKTFSRSVDNMVEEFEYIAAQGFKEVYLRDLTFGLNRKKTMEFCEKLIEKKVPLRWVCTSRVDTLDKELLTVMKKAGCMCVEFGIESGNDATLEKHKKGTTKQQAIDTFQNCRELGIETVMFMILGFPEESMEDVQKTIDFSFELKGDFVAPNLANLLPETDFANTNMVNQNNRENPWDDYSFDTQNFSHPSITQEQVTALLKKTLRKFYLRPSFIFKRLMKIRSLQALRRVCQIGINVIRVSLLQSK